MPLAPLLPYLRVVVAGGVAGAARRPVVVAVPLGEPALQQLHEAPGAHREQGLAPAQLWGWWGSGGCQAAGHPCRRQLRQLLAPLLLGQRVGVVEASWRYPWGGGGPMGGLDSHQVIGDHQGMVGNHQEMNGDHQDVT